LNRRKKTISEGRGIHAPGNFDIIEKDAKKKLEKRGPNTAGKKGKKQNHRGGGSGKGEGVSSPKKALKTGPLGKI